jgi:hypothetical protein
MGSDLQDRQPWWGVLTPTIGTGTRLALPFSVHSNLPGEGGFHE